MIDEFIEYYNGLSESEKMAIGKQFNAQVGGKLSAYNSPSPVVVGLIQLQDESGKISLLGVRRAINPKIGQVCLPGGYMEENEDIQVAVARETEEETGLKTEPQDYEVYGVPKMTNNNLLIFLVNKTVFPLSVLKGLKLNSEVSEFVSIDISTPLGFPLHENSARNWLASLKDENTHRSMNKNRM